MCLAEITPKQLSIRSNKASLCKNSCIRDTKWSWCNSSKWLKWVSSLLETSCLAATNLSSSSCLNQLTPHSFSSSRMRWTQAYSSHKPIFKVTSSKFRKALSRTPPKQMGSISRWWAWTVRPKSTGLSVSLRSLSICAFSRSSTSKTQALTFWMKTCRKSWSRPSNHRRFVARYGILSILRGKSTSPSTCFWWLYTFSTSQRSG